jgi:hypothetical protein
MVSNFQEIIHNWILSVPALYETIDDGTSGVLSILMFGIVAVSAITSVYRTFKQGSDK